LHTLLARTKAGHYSEAFELELLRLGARTFTIQAFASLDPSGQGFIVASIDIGGPCR
jgi:hypothetical protein